MSKKKNNIKVIQKTVQKNITIEKPKKKGFSLVIKFSLSFGLVSTIILYFMNGGSPPTRWLPSKGAVVNSIPPEMKRPVEKKDEPTVCRVEAEVTTSAPILYRHTIKVLNEQKQPISDAKVYYKAIDDQRIELRSTDSNGMTVFIFSRNDEERVIHVCIDYKGTTTRQQVKLMNHSEDIIYVK